MSYMTGDDWENALNDLDYRLRWVLDKMDLYDEDGVFAFPDGEMYYKQDWVDK